jgi:hypothetical protein
VPGAAGRAGEGRGEAPPGAARGVRAPATWTSKSHALLLDASPSTQTGPSTHAPLLHACRGPSARAPSCTHATASMQPLRRSHRDPAQALRRRPFVRLQACRRDARAAAAAPGQQRVCGQARLHHAARPLPVRRPWARPQGAGARPPLASRRIDCICVHARRAARGQEEPREEWVGGGIPALMQCGIDVAGTGPLGASRGRGR